MESQQLSQQQTPQISNKAHVLAFTSGKGGVGKTCITANVATAMARRGARVCIFDADTGLANINILLGLRPEFTLEHVLRGEKTIREVVIKTAEGVAVVPGASGIAECANIGGREAQRLIDVLAELEAEYDYILIDTAAGVADSVLQFIQSASSTFVVVTSEPTSLTDAFSLLKLLNAKNYGGRLKVLVNSAIDYTAAVETYRRLAAVVEKYLQIKVEYGGFVARDENVPRSVSLQLPVVELVTNSVASRCLFALADNVLKHIGSDQAEAGLADFWRTLLSEADVPVGNSGHVTGQIQVDLPKNAGEAASAATMPAGELFHKLLAAMKVQDLSREQLEVFVTQFISVFVEVHGGFPHSFRQLFYRWLESENYAASRLMELVSTLEALHATRYRQPLFSLEDSAARLVAQTQGDEAQLRELVEQFRAAYRQSFQADVFDAQQEMVEIIRRDDFSEERFEDLLRTLREAFQARFNRPYRGQGELLLESTAEALQAMASEEKDLQLEIASLTQSFQQLTTRRDALLAAIKNGQNHNLSVKARTSING